MNRRGLSVRWLWRLVWEATQEGVRTERAEMTGREVSTRRARRRGEKARGREGERKPPTAAEESVPFHASSLIQATRREREREGEGSLKYEPDFACNNEGKEVRNSQRKQSSSQKRGRRQPTYKGRRDARRLSRWNRRSGCRRVQTLMSRRAPYPRFLLSK